MPTYVYEPAGEDSCKHCRGRFEFVQAMRDAPLEACPKCGAPVRRVPVPPNIATGAAKADLSEKNLRRHGFKKLVNEGDGRFRDVTE